MQFEYKHNKITAFTLVEVVVAMALLGFSMMATFAVLNRCSVAAHHAGCVSASVLMAERLINEVRMGSRSTYESTSGREGDYAWQVDVMPTPLDNLGAVCVTVQWREQGRAQSYELVSLSKMNVLGG